ncbi:MAG TPA: DNA mismatch repair endonuclease MutL [Acholeplasma sp.]|nr:DNA mismatch repair endonuclease MutL [Acholeplasma sp.]
MSVIKQMDEKLANMIAAGEVVERPASIIKELVENSIDANATTIDIFILNNGLKEIKIVDNGIGLNEVDAQKAFLRHATSKISTEQDLTRIKTLGFRGEALAAILSVSKVTLKSRQKNSNGHYVKYEDSKLIASGVDSLNEGTEITINDLFYNTPARLKYLKSEFSERAAIIDIFDRLALSHPNIRFSLTIDEKLVKETYGNEDYFSLIRQIYGSNVLRDIKTFDETFSNINLKGYLISPQITRSRRNGITIFVNGRYIKNFPITQAVINGYQQFLMTNRYPIAVLSIGMDPYLLDVNIHPQKLEVKFSNESILKYQIESIIKNTLIDTKHKIAENIEVIDRTILKDEKYIKESLDFEYNEEFRETSNNNLQKIPEMDYIGNLASTYLMFQNEDGLYLIDQHAAEERVNYEYYISKLNDLEIITNNLLIPEHLNLTKEDLVFINNHIKQFNQLGFIFNSETKLIGHPNFILNKDLEDSITKMILMIENDEEVTTQKLLNDLAKDISCKASIKANKRLSLQEVNSLISRLRRAKNPYTCPHGRPTIIKLTHYQIERMFRRVV